MAERRSLGDAITPEKLAFITGAQPKPPQPVEKVKVIEPPVSEPQEEKPIEKKPKNPRRLSREEKPDAAEVLSQMKVAVTSRFQHRIAQALRRAHLERKLESIEPNTQQEIVEVAVEKWLNDHGYLD